MLKFSNPNQMQISSDYYDMLRVRVKISSRFQVLKRLADKTRKSMNIKHIQSFRNAVRRDASTSKVRRDASAPEM